MAGRPQYQPTPEARRQVMTMAGFGIHQTEIARLLSIDAKTLRLHFRDELDTGMTQANMRVAQALFTNAVKHNNVAAQIWWTKVRMGWRDTTDVNVTGDVLIRQLHLLAATTALDAPANGNGGLAPTINGVAEPSSSEAMPDDPMLAPLPEE